MRKPMSWKPVAARSSAAPETAILNLRGSQLNSGCSVDHWRRHLAPGARVFQLVVDGAGERIGGDVAHAIAARLNAMHLDVGERAQDLRHVDQLHPVELQILPRGEMAVAAVEAPADHGELAQLAGREHAIGNGDAQHIGVQLQIESVAQPKRTELVLGQLAGEPALDLLAKLRHTLMHESVVELVIAVHRTNPWSEWFGGRRGCARARKLQPARRR